MGQSGRRYCQHAAWPCPARGLGNTRQRLGSLLCPWPEVRNKKWAEVEDRIDGGLFAREEEERGDWGRENCKRSSPALRGCVPAGCDQIRGNTEEGPLLGAKLGTRHPPQPGLQLVQIQSQEGLLTFPSSSNGCGVPNHLAQAMPMPMCNSWEPVIRLVQRDSGPHWSFLSQRIGQDGARQSMRTRRCRARSTGTHVP